MPPITGSRESFQPWLRSASLKLCRSNVDAPRALRGRWYECATRTGSEKRGFDLGSITEIRTRPIMRMVETETGRTRSEDDAPHPARRDEGRPFLRRAIHIRRNELSVPMQLLWGVRIVVYVYRHRLALFEAQQRSRELAVISDRGDDVFGSNLDCTGFDGEIAYEVCLLCSRRCHPNLISRLDANGRSIRRMLGSTSSSNRLTTVRPAGHWRGHCKP